MNTSQIDTNFSHSSIIAAVPLEAPRRLYGVVRGRTPPPTYNQFIVVDNFFSMGDFSLKDCVTLPGNDYKPCK